MFKLFSFGKNYFLGIDFGTSAIKVVELSYKKQKVHLENYGWIETGLNPGSESKGNKFFSSFDQRLGSYLKSLLVKMDVKSKDSFISIPGYNGLVTVVEFPDMKKEDLEKAIQFEAHKHIPTSLEDVALSWDVSREDNKKGKDKRIKVVLVAAPKKEVAKYEGLVQGIGMNVNVIELEIFSLTRALIGDDPGTHIVVDVGARATNVILYEKNIVRISRNIDVGGYDITSTIADSLNVSRSRAENLKKEKGDLLNSKEMSLVVPSLELISNEILRIINTYEGIKVDSVILSGGSAKLKGIDKYLTKSLGITTVLGNPWRKIVVDKRLENVIKNEIGTSFSVAIGLALRGIENYKRK